MQHNISLLAYHLPLDAHDSLGNNAQLGALLGLNALGRFGEQQLGWIGEPSNGPFASDRALADHVGAMLGRSVTLVASARGAVQRIAWCSGAAQGYFEEAIAAGADAYVTGEISEPQAHLARECGVAYLACGHHASERYGAPAVGEFIAQKLGLTHEFIDIDNPA
jgi:dinuclear metal center YbgI/SA1388 family protein